MAENEPVSKGAAEDATQYLRFAQQRLVLWGQLETLPAAQLDGLREFYTKKRQQLADVVQQGRPLPEDLKLLPVKLSVPDSPLERPLRFEKAVLRDLKTFLDTGLLRLAEYHACDADIKERIAAWEHRLAAKGIVILPEGEAGAPASVPAGTRLNSETGGTPEPGSQIPSLEPEPPPRDKSPTAARGAEPPPIPKVFAPPRRRILDILLDPRSLQYLMIFGGALLVLGLVVWLWAVGVFENKLVVAAAMGLGTLALLGGGWAMLRFTRYQIAGQAITLLACLVMPLNLWFYHAQGLVTLAGHLWVAGVICCVLYAASAWVLRQATFVYVLMAGVTMTGMLILADENVGKLWEIAAPSTLLVILGLIALHAERAFAAEGPFSRQRFGMAFFWSGLAVLSSGLLLLFGAQLAGWLYDPYLHAFGLRERPEIADSRLLQVLALFLVLAGTYAYVYSDLVVRRASAFLYLAVFTFLWAEVLAVKVLAVELNEEVVIIALALTALVANLAQLLIGRREAAAQAGAAEPVMDRLSGSLARVGQPMGLFLCVLPVGLGLELHLRATYRMLQESWPFSIEWTYVLAMLTTAVSARVGAYVYSRTKPLLSEMYFFATAAATLLAARGMLALLGLNTTELLAPWLMLIPIAYLVAAWLYRDHPSAQALKHVAQIATAVLILAVIGETFHLTPAHVIAAVWGANTNLLLAWFFTEAAIFYVVAAAFDKRGFNVYLATATAAAAIWQLLNFWQVPEEYYTLTFAIVGLLLLIGYRCAFLDNIKVKGITEPAFQCGNALLSLAFIAAIMLTLSRLAPGGHVHASLLYLLLILIAIGLSAAWLVREAHWRRWYIVTAVANGVMTFVVLNVLSELNIWEKLEIFSVAAGLILLVIGHLGWYREHDAERHQDWVSATLFFGSVLAAMPLVLAVLIQRSHQTQDWTALRVMNEIGILAVGLVLLGTGAIFKLRATTIAGALTMTAYLLSLLFFIHLPEKLQTVAIYMMIGGGLFFGTAVLLSVYRDRLIALPGEIRRHEGVFTVLSWR